MKCKRPSITCSTITILNIEEDIYNIFWENIQARVLLLRYRELLEDPKSGGELKLQVIHLKSRVKPMVTIGVYFLFIINKFVMISRSCRQRTDDWRWPLGLLAVTSGYTHAARSIPHPDPAWSYTHTNVQTQTQTHIHTRTHSYRKNIYNAARSRPRPDSA